MWSNLFIKTVSSLSGFFIFTIIVSTILAIILATKASKVSMLNDKKDVLTIFYGLKYKGRILLSLYYLRLLFIIYTLITITVYDSLSYFVFFLLTSLILVLNFKRLFSGIINTSVIYLLLETAGMIILYNTQIYYYPLLEGIYWLLSLFIILFSFYDLLKNLEIVSKSRRDDYEEVKY